MCSGVYLIILWERDETCPVSTEGWTRRVHFVREKGGGRGAQPVALLARHDRLERQQRHRSAARGGARGRGASAARGGQRGGQRAPKAAARRGTLRRYGMGSRQRMVRLLQLLSFSRSSGRGAARRGRGAPQRAGARARGGAGGATLEAAPSEREDEGVVVFENLLVPPVAPPDTHTRA
jgi:hypothetical protein